MSYLSAFQAKFSHALTATAAPHDALRFAVYRNTVLKGSIDALVANFPTVERIVGADWLKAAARDFVAAHPPRTPSLLAYGAEFPEWLAGYEPAQALDYMAGIARLDRLWTEAHLSSDAAPAPIGLFAGLNEAGLQSTVALLHPSARLASFNRNIASLWRANRPPAVPPAQFDLVDAPEHVLLVRPAREVVCHVISGQTKDFLEACARRQPLAAAVLAARFTPKDLQNVIGECFAARVFVAIETPDEESP